MSSSIITGTMVLFALALSFSLFLVFRNEWVFRQREKLNSYWFDQSMKELDKARVLADSGNHDEWLLAMQRAKAWLYYLDEYDSYDTMMKKFWIWDIEKFRKVSEPAARREQSHG